MGMRMILLIWDENLYERWCRHVTNSESHANNKFSVNIAKVRVRNISKFRLIY